VPISAYYGGSGKKVRRDMIKRYGEKKGKSVFYATAEKHGQKPGAKRRSQMLKHWR
jgi:hypothetical protein